MKSQKGRYKEGIENRDKIYKFVSDFVREKGYSPSLKDIAEGTGFSPTSMSTVRKHVVELRAEGKLTFVDNISRSIRPTEQ